MEQIKDIINRLKELLILLLALGCATVVGYLFRHAGFPETNIVILHILAVVLVARYTQGLLFGVFASLVATFSYNYFFTVPYYTLSVDNPSYIITFFVMTLTAIITSTLTSKVKQSAQEANEKAEEINALYKLTNQLSGVDIVEDIPRIVISNISKFVEGGIACLMLDDKGMPEKTFLQQNTGGEKVYRETEDREALGRKLKLSVEPCFREAEFLNIPIRGQDEVLGLIRVPSEVKLTDARLKLIYSMAENIGMAIDKLHYRNDQILNQELMMQERYRSSLLRAISHDLRTPLAGIMGTSEMLIGMTEKNDTRYQLIQGIYQDADWLYRLVENILNLTRLRDGKLVLHKESEAVEEVIDAALQRLHKSAPLYDVRVEIPDEVIMVPMDARLIGQVFLNLLENAVKHTHDINGICIRVERDLERNEILFYVEDNGEGIAEADLPNIFQMFYTSMEKHEDAVQGVGLGLAICEAIIGAHGGHINAVNRTGRAGAEFLFTLPAGTVEEISDAE